MDGLPRAVAALVRVSARLLPADRRDWAEAARAEAANVPAGPARVRWLVGVLRLTVTPVVRNVSWILAVLGCGLVTLRLGWHGWSVNPATPIARASLVATTVLLVALPWLVRPARLLGPVGASRAARVVRPAAYAVLCALLPGVVLVTNYGGARFETCADPCTAADEAKWHSERVSDAVTGLVVILVLVTAYAVAILWLTSRRSPATPATLAIGGAAAAVGGVAVFGSMPVGGPPPASAVVQVLLVLVALAVIPGAPTAAGYLAARRTRDPGAGPAAPARRTQAPPPA